MYTVGVCVKHEYRVEPDGGMLLNDASFVIVDTETTGSRAASDRLLEIGAVRVRAGRVVDTYEELVNPECAVPSRIARLTGISSAMVFDKPTAREVLPAFFDFLGEGVFVAHNLSFDVRFLNAECRRAQRTEITNESLCTLRLARRLLPGLRSKGLASLVDFYGIRNRRHHRALADAEATAEVLLRFLEQLELEYGLERLADLLTFQYRRYSDLKQVSKHVARIREEVLSELPPQPGVYFMKDGRGSTIYVGKAKNLQNRVRSYFTSVEGHPPRIRKMVRAVRSVEWEVTASELDALLLESRLIKKLQPAYNRAQRRYVNRPFIRIDTNHPVPRVSASAFLQDDGAEYYGPMAGRGEAHFVVDLIDRFFKLRECDDATLRKGRSCVYASMDRCTAPCEGKNAEYEAELDRVRAFLMGQEASVVDRIDAAMREAASELDFEKAAMYRDWMRRLDRMGAKREAVASRVLEHNAVVIHRPEARPTRLLIVRRGRHMETVVVHDDLEDLGRLLEHYFTHGSDGPEIYREREVDELHLLSHWLYVHRREIRQIRWIAGEPVEDLLDRIRTELGVAVPPVAAAL